MEKLIQLAQQILEKLADFFDILDLSFFISGAMVLAASYVLLQHGVGAKDLARAVAEMSLFFMVVSCYVLGLISFAFGRSLRRRFIDPLIHPRPVTSTFWPAEEAHGILARPPFDRYQAVVAAKGQDRHLTYAIYTRLWVELRQNVALKESYTLLRRYWVMSATFDGIAVSLVFWAMVAIVAAFHVDISHPDQAHAPDLVRVVVCGLASLSFVVLAFPCFREASRFQQSQVEELVATMAWLQDQPEGSKARPRPADPRGKERAEDGGAPTAQGGEQLSAVVEAAQIVVEGRQMGGTAVAER